MTPLKTYRHFQQLILKAKSRPISSLDWEKIDRISNELYLKALNEARYTINTSVEIKSFEPPKESFRIRELWSLIPKWKIKSLACWIP